MSKRPLGSGNEGLPSTAGRARPTRLRVIVADDSITVRKSLVRALSQAGDIDVVAEAADGAELVEQCLRLRPDVITLDVVMPVVDGVLATEQIMAQAPTPILVVSAAENRGDRFTTLSALAAGAVDVLEKPTHSSALDSFDERLRRAVRLVSRIPVITHPRARLARRVPPTSGEPTLELSEPVNLVAIGASTGGPATVAEILRQLPGSFSLPIVLVMHIGPAFGFALSEWLGSVTKLAVEQIESGQLPLPGKVYVCPPERHVVMRAGRLWLTQDAERHSCRPSVDVLFESLAEQLGARAVGCLLTGIGRDGALGLLAMRKRGALTIAQDEASSVVFGMPREAQELGAARHVANPAGIVAMLLRIAAGQNAS
jgi:two-component system chemotaxis response regulator CheB